MQCPENLEQRIGHTPRSAALKSQGEYRIAGFLDRHNIPYIYESPVAIDQRGKTRIWYPDFFLPDYGLYIEYYGMIGSPDYDRGVVEKTAAYAASGLTVIPVYPCHLHQSWPQYLSQEIHHITTRRAHLANTNLPQTPRTAGYGERRGY